MIVKQIDSIAKSVFCW